MKSQKERAPESADIIVGQRVRSALKEKGWSMQDLAAKVGVTFQQVQKYITGANRISVSRLVMIADALEIDISDFVGGLQKGAHKRLTAIDLSPAAQRAVKAIDAIPEGRRTKAIRLLEDLASA